QLIAVDGFSEEQLATLSGELGAEKRDGLVRPDILFVPSKQWAAGRPLLVRYPDSRPDTFRTIAKIPPPKSHVGYHVIRDKLPVQVGNVDLSFIPLGGGQEIGANSYLLRIGGRRL